MWVAVEGVYYKWEKKHKRICLTGSKAASNTRHWIFVEFGKVMELIAEFWYVKWPRNLIEIVEARDEN